MLEATFVIFLEALTTITADAHDEQLGHHQLGSSLAPCFGRAVWHLTFCQLQMATTI
jgi:hypothetical protein